MKDTNEKIQISLIVPKNVYDGMRYIAERTDRSMTGAIVNACRKAIENNKDNAWLDSHKRKG